MATERLSMRKTREILRQKLELNRSHREVAASVGLSVGAVSATLVRAAAAGLTWAAAEQLSDEALTERLYARPVGAARPRLAPVKDQERRDLLEVMEDRYGTRSTIMTSQLPPTKWHDHLGDPTMADAICDRLLHNAHRLALKGPSRRKEDPATDK